MNKSDYRTTETTVYCCRYHIIFCPKYRRKVLINGIDERFKEIVFSMQEEQNFYVLQMEVMPDHVHLLLDVDPTIGINVLVSRIKGKTAHIMQRVSGNTKKAAHTLDQKQIYCNSRFCIA